MRRSATCKSPKNAKTPSGSQRQNSFIIVIVKCEMPKQSYLRMVLQVALVNGKIEKEGENDFFPLNREP